MNTQAAQNSSRSLLQLLFAGIGISLLVPLFPIPGLIFVTGHPWKVELLWAVGVLAFSLFGIKYKAGVSGRRTSLFQPHIAVVLPLLLFTVWSGISVIWADVVSSVVHHTGVWFLYTAVYLAALIFFLKAKSVGALYQVCAFVSVTVFVLAAIDYVTMPDFTILEGQLRVRYAKYGEMLAMVAPFLCSGAFLVRNQIAKGAFFGISSLAWLTVMLSLSKGAFLAGIGGYAILFGGVLLFSSKKLRGTLIFAAVLWVILTVTVQISVTRLTEFPSTSQYISGQADNNRETSMFRTFVWQIGAQMVTSHPFKGVGADNFGTSFNSAREEYAKGLPVENKDSVAEDIMPERAHNEAIQILAELGIAGIILLTAAALVFIVPLVNMIRLRRSVSPVLIGCISGMSAFILSSMVSSFSFRAMQNGLVFFLLFAAGMYEISKSYATKDVDRHSFTTLIPFLRWPAVVFSVALVLFFSAAGTSNLYTMFASTEKDPGRARKHLETALAINPENAAAYSMAGNLAYMENRPLDAARNQRKALKYGVIATLTYYNMVKSYERAGDLEMASESIAEAVRIYPQSVYARVHYSILLSKLRRSGEAASQFATARLINARQAETWRLVLENGLLSATNETRNNKSLDMPYLIRPGNIIKAIYAEERMRAQNGLFE